MKFKIEETTWAHNGNPKFAVFEELSLDTYNYLSSHNSIEIAHEYCKSYKLAREAEPKITYLEI